MPCAGVAAGNSMRTPLPTWRKIWLWYLARAGSSSPKKTKTAASARARGVRVRRSHSSLQRLMRPDRAGPRTLWIIELLLLCARAGQRKERRFQVGRGGLAGDLAGGAGGDDRGDAALARLDRGGVDPDGVGPVRLDPGRPRLAGHRRGDRCRVTRDPGQPAPLEVGVAWDPGGAP